MNATSIDTLIACGGVRASFVGGAAGGGDPGNPRGSG